MTIGVRKVTAGHEPIKIIIILFTVQVGLPLTILNVVAPLLCGAKNKGSWFRAGFAKYIKIRVECAMRQLVYIVKMDDAATKLCTCHFEVSYRRCGCHEVRIT